jgi:hypothetical membrane protein
MARFGTPSPVIGAIMVLISISMTPGWSLRQPLSDLGSEGLGSVIFNNGLLMSGALTMLFAAALFEFTKGDIIGRVGSAAFLLYAIAMCGVGVVVIDLGVAHDQFATILFLMIPISSALISYNLYRRGLMRYAALGVIALLFGVAPWVIGGSVDAVKELVALIPFGIWHVMLGLHMYGLEEPNEFD